MPQKFYPNSVVCTLSRQNMCITNISLRLFFLVLLTIFKSQADSSACERKEKLLAILDLAKESISKAKHLQPACFKESKDISSNSSECGAKEKVSAYLDVAKNLIEEAKESYSTCDETGKFTKVELLHNKPIDCSEILENGENKSGEYIIWPRHRIFNGTQLKVYCDMDTDGGGWTMIQRRGNFSNKIDFYRDWNDYKYGFGNISEEFWLGNNNIFALTNQGDYTVRFDMKNAKNEYRYASYSSFRIDDESAGYMLHFDKYSGTAGDGIRDVANMKFSTKDRSNLRSYGKPCTTTKGGGWWYNYCGYSNPNGIYAPEAAESKKNMNWHPWTKYGPLLEMEIKIRAEK
ncbi:unnamed protein product [Larinioides sclopetarius]|uniref:Fibrinogen C-terminal domain-containing protein n=1 Tax=Larinioides sclopetarius TaxID=280406 RepID=A0AAV2AYP4_9ARAC